MPAGQADALLEVFSTCPPSSGIDDPGSYLQRVIEASRWSEEHDCRGILVYSDNSQLDAWLLSHLIVQHTRSLSPLVAVQPVYMHPYAVAKAVTSIGQLYGRRLYLNMVAGGFRNDLTALDDTTPHDRRYDRLVEYVRIVSRLLDSPAAVTFAGEFYRVDRLRLTPPLAPELRPEVFVSGSSAAGVAAARALAATAIKYPAPPDEQEGRARVDEGLVYGIRVGIIARQREAEAWEVARDRFPEDRKGQLTRQLATKVSDSVWHRQLTERTAACAKSAYWLVPFENYQTMCPYLVGSYEQVAVELARYVKRGCRRLILDVPPSADDLAHAFAAVAAATQAVVQ